MKGIFVAIFAVAVGATAVWADDDPIALRKANMKALSAKLADVGKMAKGEAPFDLAKVQAGLKAIEETSKAQLPLFPESSKAGSETTASPKIWENKADFDARYTALAAAAQAAESKITDEASFKATFPTVTKNCGACHELYRVRKS
jgi:cytochrome c556